MSGALDLRDGDKAAGENRCCAEAVHPSRGDYCNYLALWMLQRFSSQVPKKLSEALLGGQLGYANV